MMLSKPEQTEDGVKPKALDTEKKAQEVADLERRLADLSTASIDPSPAAPVSMDPFAPQPVAAPAPASKPAAAGGKSALLARIMAAQERAKQSQPAANNSLSAPAQPPSFASPPPAFAAPPPAMDLKPPPPSFAAPPQQTFGAPPAPAFSMAPPAPSGPPPSMDLLLMDSSAPAAAAPPAFDQSFLPPPSAAAPPPAFDAMSLPSQAPPAMQFDPMAALAPPSAPAFEDLMMDASPPPAMMPPAIQPPPPQEESGGLDEETIQAIMAMDGMSEADKQSMIEEQLKIMKSIEAKKKPPQVSAADAFEQRSFSAAVQAAGRSSAVQTHGQERTQAAIEDGTAVMVQCTSCENWMQVTGAAQLMFCPVCQTVTPVVRADGGTMPEEDADQMAADLRLAEQLQKEEYAAADQTAARGRSRAAASSQATANTSSASSSWMGWLGFGSPAPAPAREEEVSFSRSGESSLQGGQTAGQAPLFACVTDSINNAANYAMSLQEDEEGNVHGVDASSLLAVPQVGRNTDQSNN